MKFTFEGGAGELASLLKDICWQYAPPPTDPLIKQTLDQGETPPAPFTQPPIYKDYVMRYEPKDWKERVADQLIASEKNISFAEKSAGGPASRREWSSVVAPEPRSIDELRKMLDTATVAMAEQDERIKALDEQRADHERRVCKLEQRVFKLEQRINASGDWDVKAVINEDQSRLRNLEASVAKLMGQVGRALKRTRQLTLPAAGGDAMRLAWEKEDKQS